MMMKVGDELPQMTLSLSFSPLFIGSSRPSTLEKHFENLAIQRVSKKSPQDTFRILCSRGPPPPSSRTLPFVMVDERYLPSLMQNWDRKSYLSKNTIVDEFRCKTENVE